MKSTLALFLALFLTATSLFGWEHGGFAIDDSRISATNPYFVRLSINNIINNQIDVINKLPLDHSNLEFFHSLPIVLINDSTMGDDGYYYDGRKNLKDINPQLWSSIPLNSIVININKLTQLFGSFPDTALLYPLFWALVGQEKIYEGYNNSELCKYAQEADNNNFYNYNWEDNYDQYSAAFFADTATAFFLGHGINCSSRQEIEKKQPTYYSVLKDQFFSSVTNIEP